jgi:hypothetical protein
MQSHPNFVIQADHLFTEKRAGKSKERALLLMAKHVQAVHEIFKETVFTIDGSPKNGTQYFQTNNCVYYTTVKGLLCIYYYEPNISIIITSITTIIDTYILSRNHSNRKNYSKIQRRFK